LSNQIETKSAFSAIIYSKKSMVYKDFLHLSVSIDSQLLLGYDLWIVDSTACQFMLNFCHRSDGPKVFVDASVILQQQCLQIIQM
jgi:hypothetical protein